MLLRLLTAFFLASRLSVSAADTSSNATQLIRWLLDDANETGTVPFADIIRTTSGRQIIAFNTTNAADRELLAKIGGALDQVVAEVNASESAAQKEKRINEASRHFEDALKRALNAVPGFACDVPRTAAGAAQRSGYPDLRLTDKTTGRVIYLDPKLYDAKSRASSLRTFYFTPRRETNKVNDDAHHLIVGFPHAERVAGRWAFTGWELVDLARFKVRLKAEFQASNRDLYQDAAIVGRSGAKK